MDNQEIIKNLGKLAKTLNSQRVISEGEIQEVLQAIVAILNENKKGLENLTSATKTVIEKALKRINELDVETQDRIKSSLASLDSSYQRYDASLKQNSAISKEKFEKAVKAQNDRAFERLQGLIASIRIPENGKDGSPGQNGKDGSPDTPIEVRDKLETLEDDERLDASAIKNLDKFFGRIKRKGKDMLVGGIRFFENLADVSIVVTKKRQDLLAQYNTTNNRWENGVAFTVSLTAPTSPQVNDVWIDIN